MSNYIISHFNLKDADIYNPDEKMYTYFFKDPIVLNEEYITKISSFNFLEGSGAIQTFIDINDIEIDFSSNSGFITGNSIQTGSVGFWQFKIPNTDISILIEVFDPLFSALYARIIQVFWNGGHNDASVIFESSVIEIPNADVYRASNNDYGWYKTAASGPLKIIINSVQTLPLSYNNINVHVKNLKFSNVKHFNTDKGSLPRIGTFNNNTNNIYSNKLELLTLEPQIINNVTFKIYDENNYPSFFFSNTENSHILNFSLIMKKKNLTYNYIDE